MTSAKGGAATHNSGATILKVASNQASTSVTLNNGTYIMASGGFFVCGSANLSAPQVMIYNTNDQVGATQVAAIGQVSIFTLGSVNLGPQLSGLYEGLTIFQDHTNEVNTAKKCDQKSNDSSSWDIALIAMANTGANGALGSVTESICAHNTSGTNPMRDDFGDVVSGTTTMAVMTDCIFIDGANSTFNFETSTHPLFGLSATLSG